MKVFVKLGVYRIRLSDIATYRTGKTDRDNDYLQVKLYTGENYVFIQNEVDFDIFEKCKELDQCLL